MILNNITFNEYYELADKKEYDFAIRYDRKYFNVPKDNFDIGDFAELRFKTIKDMQYYIDNGLQWEHVFELLEVEKGIKTKTLGSMLLVDLCQFKSYLVEQIYTINKIESMSLGHSMTSDEDQAGLDEVAALGSYLQFISLANDDITKLEQIENMPYSKCFLELVRRKRVEDYKARYMKIKSKK